jgi:hypothetical protein
MRSFRLNGWVRIGVCATVIYLIGLHAFVFLDGKSAPKPVFNPAMIRPSTVFHDWNISSSANREKEFRARKGLPPDYKLTESEFLSRSPTSGCILCGFEHTSGGCLCPLQ